MADAKRQRTSSSVRRVIIDTDPGIDDSMCIFMALAPLLQAHLDRKWLPLLTATDAAPEYGFGGSVCEMAADAKAGGYSTAGDAVLEGEPKAKKAKKEKMEKEAAPVENGEKKKKKRDKEEGDEEKPKKKKKEKA